MNNNNPEGYFFFTTAFAGFWCAPDAPGAGAAGRSQRHLMENA